MPRERATRDPRVNGRMARGVTEDDIADLAYVVAELSQAHVPTSTPRHRSCGSVGLCASSPRSWWSYGTSRTWHAFDRATPTCVV
jgi:hypothetical protein